VDQARQGSSFAQENSVDRLGARIREALEARHLASVETELLRPLDAADAERSGSKPLIRLTDPQGRRYVLKLAPAELVAAEVCAYELRSLGGRPSVPVRAVDVALPGGARASGVLKTFLEFDLELQLSNDSRTWSELQRCVILREHAWDWFLDNMDTNTTQYALLGVEGYPLNIDWDRSFASEAQSEFSRFAKYRSTLPNARTFLYSDYVEGRVLLNFAFLRQEARLIRKLPTEAVRRSLRAYALRRYPGDPAQAEQFVLRAIERKRRIEREAEEFVRRLRAERAVLAGAPQEDLLGKVALFPRFAWNHWQKALDTIGRGPVGTTARRALKLVRARTFGARREDDGASPPASNSLVSLA
jgi:hypothetical protein